MERPSPLSSLERVEKINSIYLQKGKIRLGYGLFIINDRIVGVKASRWYLFTSIIHAPMIMLGSFWGLLLLFLGLGGQFGVVLFVPVIVEVVWAAVNSIQLQGLGHMETRLDPPTLCASSQSFLPSTRACLAFDQ